MNVGKSRSMKKQRLVWAAGVTTAFAVLSLVSPALASAAPLSHAADALAQPLKIEQEQSCPVGVHAIVPGAAAVRARGVAALVPADATVAAAAAIEANPVMRRAASQNAQWVSALDCKSSDRSNGSGVAKTSSNWSGYQYNGIDYNHAYYEQAAMIWQVPGAESGVIGTTRNDSIWPGIGTGASKEDALLQAGTQTVAGPAGYQGTYAWLEVYPTMPTESIIGSLSVDAHDTVGAIVTMNAANEGFFDVCDYTKNKCAAAEDDLSWDSSQKNYGLLTGQEAEWIAERPGIPGGYSELNNFGSLQISDANGYEERGGGTGTDLFNVNGINNQPGVTKTQIEMTSCKGATALTGYPSIPDVNGTFTIPWKNHGSLEHC
jgi:hypothetical protein